ncbi:DUF2079 domain-containing protein [Actinomadura sp. 3N508]|uniref:DUF2079 domain-containing protein n=1 Tax=Actinomadura sp. 3N508 TaxID=3375153 RepID=UPI0037B554B2
METAAYDLGIFDQVMREYSEFRAPVVPIKGPGANLLGDHFHPILVTLAPGYWVWPDARTLLLAQAALVAASVIPISRLAIARLGYARGAAISLAYGLSWGLQGAIAFDFHEVAFAVPLVAFGVVSLAEERWRAAVAWTFPLLLVKEDLGLVVASVGVYLVFKKRYRLGIGVIVTGVAGLLLILLVLIPAFSWNGKYRYWGQMSEGGEQNVFQTVLELPASMIQHPQKLVLILCLLVVTSFVAIRSPILLVGLPVVLYRIVSTQPPQWSIGEVHYNAILMPIIYVALLDAVRILGAGNREISRRVARTAPVFSVVVSLALLPYFSFWRFTDPAFYRTSPHVAAAQRLLAEIPDGASVAASNYLAAQLTDRCEVTLFADVHHRPVDWVIVDSKRLGGVPAPPAVQQARLSALPSEGFKLVRQDDGIMLFVADP